MENDSLLSLYFKDLTHLATLSELRQNGQTEDCNPQEQYKRQLIESHLKLVIYIARQFKGLRRLDLLDLVQEGNLGLIKAVEEFDPKKDVTLTTYAYHCIRNAMLDAISDHDGLFKFGTTASDLVKAIRNASDVLNNTLGREPSIQEMADYLQINPKRISNIIRATSNTLSVDDLLPGEESDTPLRERLKSKEASVEEQVVTSLDCQKLQEKLKNLSEPEKFVVGLRWFENSLPDNESVTGQRNNTPTFEDIGKSLGVTRQRAQQIHKEALDKLRHSLAEEDAAA